MAKRFTDSDKWKKPLIRSLKAPYKLLWLYILDDCDHAGIWQVDIDVAEIRIGEKLDRDEAIASFGDRIQVIDSGEKWFIRDFIEFQYGELNPSNRVHVSVIDRLKKYKIKPLDSPLNGAMDKDKERDKEKDKEKDFPTIEQVIKYFNENGYDDEVAKKAFLYYATAGWKDSRGKQIKNWKQKMISVWFKDENKIKTENNGTDKYAGSRRVELRPA